MQLVESAYREKNMSLSRINSVIKAVKDKKGLPTSWLLLPLLFRKPSGKTVNAANIQKALATFQLILKPKKSGLSPRTCFCNETITHHTTASVQDFKWRPRRQDNPEASLFTDPHSGLFPFGE